MTYREPVMKKVAHPKSYLSDEERQQFIREGCSQDFIYTVESCRAGDAGDEDSAWTWLSMSELEGASLMFLKKQYGPDFVREWGFDTRQADQTYGPGWLDKQ